MSNLLISSFGLSEIPFSKEIADGDLWLPSSKKALVDDLCEAVNDHASILLVGEPGVGKSCVLRALRHRLPEAGFRLTYCSNVTLGRRDFYRQLCLALGLSPKATAAAVFHTVSTHVQQLGQERVHPVFLLDEAHLMHQDTFEHLHILLNYEWDRRALLSLILVGLPELRDRLEMRRNRSLHSRLHHRFEIDALSPQDTAEYIHYRMRRAGCDRDVFTSDAIALLHEAATGGMRDIDRIAGACLREAARTKRKLVERDILLAFIEQETRR